MQQKLSALMRTMAPEAALDPRLVSDSCNSLADAGCVFAWFEDSFKPEIRHPFPSSV
ncbi:MAG TPA: hypothetical protein VHC96_15300 [Puia sp.]|nr:hypothetical protein [Puia sp.]